MEPIFLQDYANNVAQAQDPFGIASVQAQPGFENYTPSFVNEDINTNMNFQPDGPVQLPDFKEVAKTVATNQAKQYLTKKLGLEGIKAQILDTVMTGGGANMTGIVPLTALSYGIGSGSNFIKNYLTNKRANKAYQTQQDKITAGLNKSTTAAIQQKIDAQNVSPQDKGRGIPPSAPATYSAPATQARQTSGAGGLHSGY